jgi:hypothetical protein
MLTGLRSTGLRKIGMMYRHGHAGLRETGIDDASCVRWISSKRTGRTLNNRHTWAWTGFGFCHMAKGHLPSPNWALRSCPCNHGREQVNLIMTWGTSLHSKSRADHAADKRYNGQRHGGRRPSNIDNVLTTRWKLTGSSRCRLWGQINEL